MKFAVGIRKRRQVKTGYKRKPQKREWVKDKEPTTKDNVTTYYWKKAVWSDWSEWCDTRFKPGSERKVETKQEYVY